VTDDFFRKVSERVSCDLIESRESQCLFSIFGQTFERFKSLFWDLDLIESKASVRGREREINRADLGASQI